MGLGVVICYRRALDSLIQLWIHLVILNLYISLLVGLIESIISKPLSVGWLFICLVLMNEILNFVNSFCVACFPLYVVTFILGLGVHLWWHVDSFNSSAGVVIPWFLIQIIHSKLSREMAVWGVICMWMGVIHIHLQGLCCCNNGRGKWAWIVFLSLEFARYVRPKLYGRYLLINHTLWGSQKTIIRHAWEPVCEAFPHFCMVGPSETHLPSYLHGK